MDNASETSTITPGGATVLLLPKKHVSSRIVLKHTIRLIERIQYIWSNCNSISH